jgi:hypothetical protein
MSIYQHARRARPPQIGPGLRARVRAQLHGLCKGDPEPAAEELVAAFGFVYHMDINVI